MNLRWFELEKQYGYNRIRILAHAVSWAFRPDNWQFLPWYKYLKTGDLTVVDEYFDEMLRLELRDMSEYQQSDISHLISYFKLPPINNIYTKIVKENREFYQKEKERLEKKRRKRVI